MLDKKILLVFHSQSKKVQTMAATVEQGLRQEEQVELRVKRAFDADANDLRWCDGLVIGSPENFGYMAGAIKDFFDRTYYQVLDEQLSLPYVLFIGAGNDGSGASREIQRIAKGYPFHLVSEPLICNTEITEEVTQACEEFGHAFAAGLAMGIF